MAPNLTLENIVGTTFKGYFSLKPRDEVPNVPFDFKVIFYDHVHSFFLGHGSDMYGKFGVIGNLNGESMAFMKVYSQSSQVNGPVSYKVTDVSIDHLSGDSAMKLKGTYTILDSWAGHGPGNWEMKAMPRVRE